MFRFCIRQIWENPRSGSCTTRDLTTYVSSCASCVWPASRMQNLKSEHQYVASFFELSCNEWTLVHILHRTYSTTIGDQFLPRLGIGSAFITSSYSHSLKHISDWYPCDCNGLKQERHYWVYGTSLLFPYYASLSQLIKADSIRFKSIQIDSKPFLSLFKSMQV